MKRVLVAHATNAGSTQDVAEAVGEELRKEATQVGVRRIDGAFGVEGYDAVVVGAPMIMGWRHIDRVVEQIPVRIGDRSGPAVGPILSGAGGRSVAGEAS